MEPGLGNHLLSPERAEVSRLARPGRRHVRPGCWHRPSGRPAWTPLSSRTHRPARASMAAPPPRSQRRDAALLPAPGLQERPRSGDPALPQLRAPEPACVALRACPCHSPSHRSPAALRGWFPGPLLPAICCPEHSAGHSALSLGSEGRVC